MISMVDAVIAGFAEKETERNPKKQWRPRDRTEIGVVGSDIFLNAQLLPPSRCLF